MNIKKSVLILSFFTLALSPNLWAQEGMTAQVQKMFEDMQKQMAQMQRTIEQQNAKIVNLENRNPQVQIAAPNSGTAMTEQEFNEKLGTALGGADKWLKDLKFGGDFRLRYDGQYFDDRESTAAKTPERNRFRFRLRYGFEKKLSDETSVGFSMGSGESLTTNGLNGDQTSQNQTLTGLFNYKNIWIDRAWATYKPNFMKGIGPIDGVEITGGKWKNVFQDGSSDMIWDGDVTPEGAYEKTSFKFIETPDLLLKGSLTGGAMILQESSTHGKDAELYALQAVLNPIFQTPLSDHPIGLKTAASYYYYDRYARNSNDVVGAASFARGNSDFNGDGNLDALSFNVLNYYVELSVNPFGNILVRPFGEFATNVNDQSGTHENKAYQYGVKVGDLKKKGDWQVSYAYKRIENNAVVGAFNDSDFGNGYAGKVGSVLKFGYQLSDNVTLNWAGYAVNNLTEGTAGVREQGQYRMQADILLKI